MPENEATTAVRRQLSGASELEYRDMILEAIDNEYRQGLAYLKSVGWELPSGVASMLESNPQFN